MSQIDSSDILNPAVEKYLEGLVRPRDKILTALEKDAEINSVPIIGPRRGVVLSLVAAGARAKRILEIGTATGYSGLLLARVAKKNSGRLTTIDIDPKTVQKAKRSFSLAGLSGCVETILRDAKNIVPEIALKRSGKFDVVFLDVGDKSLYPDLLEPCIDALRVGGYLIADNTLRHGKVADPTNNEKETLTIRKFNQLVYKEKRLLPLIIPLADDGITIALKVKN